MLERIEQDFDEIAPGDFNALGLTIADSKRIRSWSSGEVTDDRMFDERGPFGRKPMKNGRTTPKSLGVVAWATLSWPSPWYTPGILKRSASC